MRSFAVAAVLAAHSLGQEGVWEQLPSPGTPASPRAWSPSRLCFDEQRQVAVLVDVMPSAIETWEYDRHQWVRRAVYPDPSGGFVWISELVWDTGRNRVVTASSIGPTLYLSEWDGTDWRVFAHLGLGGALPAAPIGLAFDPVQQALVLACTVNGAGATMIYSGGTFTAAGPGVPFDTLCWDAARQQVAASVRPGAGTVDIREWNGSQWVTVGSLATPITALVADPARNRILVQTRIAGLMQWDGTVSTSVFTYPSSASPAGVMARDPLDDTFLLWSTANGVPEARRYREVAPATFTVVGTGCPGPNGTPTLGAATTPVIGRPFQLQVGNVAPGSAVLGVAGLANRQWNGQPLPFSLGPLGAPGCSLWIEPFAALALVGGSSWGVPWSADPAFAGLEFYVQADVLAPGWNALGVVVSNAGSCRVGVR